MYTLPRPTRLQLGVAFACVACFLLGLGAAVLFNVRSWSHTPPPLREGGHKYTYINPLLLCQTDENTDSAALLPLKKDIEEITDKAQQDSVITDSSIYIRFLNTGEWTGLNEDVTYTPASLLKVPILIAYLKKSEQDPSVLQQKYYYVQEEGEEPPLVGTPILATQHSYTVSDLLRGMIIDSDNTAKDMLESGLDQDFINEIYTELGVQTPYYGTSRFHYEISTKTYALFFRILYNATLLRHSTSEKALEMLSEVKYAEGLRAGIPTSVPLAHKYGFFVEKEDAPRVIELSDCGIVYYPQKPYLLCVMVKGNSASLAASYIRNIAAASYQFASTLHRAL